MADTDWRREIRAAFARRDRSVDSDVVEELAVHAEASYAAARADGLDRDEARERVRRDIDVWSADVPGTRPGQRRPPAVDPPPAPAASALTGLRQDVQYAVRLARRRPAAAALPVATVALGIAAATTLVSLAYGVLLRPLPWPDAGRLVRVTETRERATRRTSLLTNITYHAWADGPGTVEGLAAYSNRMHTLDLGDGIERVRGAAVTASLFPLLRAQAAHGRVFVEDDQDVALVSEGFAARRFGAASDAVGEQMRLGETSVTVVGVMPRGFGFPATDVDVWTPFDVPPATMDGSLSFFSAIARLRPDVTVEQAASEATARGRAAPDPGRVVLAVFGGGGAVHVSVVRWIESVTQAVRPALLALLAGVGLLVAAAVGNLVSLQIAAAGLRRRELAIRASIGAGRGRLARQLLVEALMTAAAGGVAGLALARWIHDLLPAILPADFPRVESVSLDVTAVVFGAALALAIGLLLGVLPAAQAGRLDLAAALATDGQAPVGHGRRTSVGRARTAVMAGQIGVSVLLLIGAGLLGRTLVNLTRIDPGFRPDHLLTGRVVSTVPATPDRGLPGLADIVERLRVLPGVAGVAAASALPLPATGESVMSFHVEADESHPLAIDVQTRQRSVTPDYFEVLGMRLLEGRMLQADDARRTGTTAAVVNRTFARAYLAERALGPLARQPDGTASFDIVGVVDDVRLPNGETNEPEMFVPLGDLDRMTGQPVLYLRTAGEPASAVPAVRDVIRRASSTMGFDSAMSMDERLAMVIAGPRLYAVVAGVFGVFALVVAFVGLFGVLSAAVAARRRELGVRAALGATPGRMARLVVGQSVVPLALGAAAGCAAAAFLTRYLSSLLYGVVPHDPLTFAAVPLVIVAAAALACLVPARRAAAVDPLTALRHG